MTDDVTAAVGRSEVVTDESVSHYRVQKLADGSVRVRAGGHVVGAPTYYEALARFAESEAERIEDAADHLKDDKRESISHDCGHPEHEVPVVVGERADGETDLLRVCDLPETAERVADAYRPGGTIITETEYVEIRIETVHHGARCEPLYRDPP
jgi:hypothetical protein